MTSNSNLAERTGLEPATPGVTGRYSNQLNYRSSFLYSHLQDTVTFLQVLRHFHETPLNLASPRGFEPLYSP
jgi:Txe/YoeB family toxin of Txe-Axe toxin-antitoxin module